MIFFNEKKKHSKIRIIFYFGRGVFSLNVVTWWQNLELKCHLVTEFGNMPYLFLKFVGIFVKIESYSNLFLLILGSPFPSAASPLAVGSPGMGPRPSPRGAGPLPSPHSGSGGQSSQTGNRNQVPASRLVDLRFGRYRSVIKAS